MAVSLVAHVPHSPLLVGKVGGERTASLSPTLEALEQLAVEIAQARVDTLVAIGDHGDLRPDTLTLCQPRAMELQLRKFGDVSTRGSWVQDVAFGYRVREYGETNLKLTTVAPAELGYAVGVPLLFLAAHAPNVRVACFGPALLPMDDHRSLGLAIRHVAEMAASRVAIVSVGDVPLGNREFGAAMLAALTRSRGAGAASWDGGPEALPWRSAGTALAAAEGLNLAAEVLAEQYVHDTGLLTVVLRP